MAKPDILIVDGHALSWQRLCDLRRQQLEAWKKTEGRQPALFELRDDHRPPADRTATGRYRSRACRQSGSPSKGGPPVTGAASLISVTICAAAETAPRRGALCFAAGAAI